MQIWVNFSKRTIYGTHVLGPLALEVREAIPIKPYKSWVKLWAAFHSPPFVPSHRTVTYCCFLLWATTTTPEATTTTPAGTLLFLISFVASRYGSVLGITELMLAKMTSEDTVQLITRIHLSKCKIFRCNSQPEIRVAPDGNPGQLTQLASLIQGDVHLSIDVSDVLREYSSHEGRAEFKKPTYESRVWWYLGGRKSKKFVSKKKGTTHDERQLP